MEPKHEFIPLHAQELNCREGVYELEDLVGKKAFCLNLPPKLGPTKKNSSCKFSQSLARKCLSQIPFPYFLLPQHERAK
jgi:hypothetical protein